jgi:GT2 family glycosyltransferase
MNQKTFQSMSHPLEETADSSTQGETYIASIVIPTKGRRESMLRTLDAVLFCLPSDIDLEIIVIEETGTPQPIREERVKYCPIPERGLGFGYVRNLGLRKAKGSIVIFIDDDVMPSQNWFDNLFEPFSEDSVVGVQGGVTVPATSNAIGWAESILGFPGGGIARVLQAKGENRTTKEISTLNCAYRKWVIEEVGGFDENLILGSEDFLLAKQACLYGRCLFVPDALVYHEARGSLKKIWHWFVRRGRAQMRLVKLRKLKETNLVSILKESISFKSLLVVLAGALFPRFLILIIFIALVAYFVLQLKRYLWPWKLSNAPVKTIFLLPFVKLVMDSGMDWGRVRGLLFD